MTNVPNWIRANGAQHRRKVMLRNVKRLLRLIVIAFFVYLVAAFGIAAHFAPWLIVVLCGLAAAGVYVDLVK